jgi:hypothetical protein
VSGEVVSGEQGVEDWFGDQVLGQHTNRVSAGDGVVKPESVDGTGDVVGV